MVALEDKQVYENEQKLVVRYVSRECLLAIYSDSYLPFFFFVDFKITPPVHESVKLMSYGFVKPGKVPSI